MKKALLLSLSLLTLILFSCKEDKCTSEQNARILSSETPAGAKTNEEVVIPISIQCYNGCGQFLECIDSKTGNDIEIVARARYEGCYCTMDTPIRSGEYIFKATQPGTYYLYFKSDNDADIDTIVVTN